MSDTFTIGQEITCRDDIGGSWGGKIVRVDADRELPYLVRMDALMENENWFDADHLKEAQL